MHFFAFENGIPGKQTGMFDIESEILKKSGASSIDKAEEVQCLWSGYGEIKRYTLSGAEFDSLIVKHIKLPDRADHPKGWNSPLSHQRKLKSYEVEKNWYLDYASQNPSACRIPALYHAEKKGSELLLIMEDLNSGGFPVRLVPEEVRVYDAQKCMTWLAAFHAHWLGRESHGLWETGTYWHLDTRPEEWEKMKNSKLKKAAAAIDEKLGNARFQSIVHGDAKLANFCFDSKDLVAAVDFQYVGKGCGMKDVAYFISSCFDEIDCEKYADNLLDFYFNQLKLMLDNSADYEELKSEWMSLYAYAWADLYRFLDGWSPGHWKMHRYSEKLTSQVLKELEAS